MTITQLMNKHAGEIVRSTATCKEVRIAGELYTLVKTVYKKWTLSTTSNFELVEFYDTLSEAYNRISELVDTHNSLNYDELNKQQTFKVGDIVQINDETVKIVDTMGAYYIVLASHSNLQRAVNKQFVNDLGVLVNE